MRKRRIKVINNENIITNYIKINKETDILAKQNYVIKYFINY
jgi:hypothetical protein